MLVQREAVSARQEPRPPDTIKTAARLKVSTWIKGLNMETDANQIHTKSSVATAKPKSGKRKWWRAIGIVGIGLLVFILAIPTILGTRWIYEPLIKRLALDQFILNIESVQLGWFSHPSDERRNFLSSTQ